MPTTEALIPAIARRIDVKARSLPHSGRAAPTSKKEGRKIATVTMVVADEVPEVVMFEGNPFLHHANTHRENLVYRQVQPYRADALVIEEAGI